MKKLIPFLFLAILTACSDTTKHKPASHDTSKPISISDKHPKSFRSAKSLAMKIYDDRRQTFYCGCDFTRTKKIQPKRCGYKVYKQATRGARVEFEHIVSAWEFGHQRQCWQKGGRKHCERNDKIFKAIEADLHNLVPSVGELNAARSNFQYAMLAGETKHYGKCDFEVDTKRRRAEPMPSVRGNIARTYFYMADRYHLRLSPQQQKLFMAWHKQDPVDNWELERNRRIEKNQGNGNCYIEGRCQWQSIK